MPSSSERLHNKFISMIAEHEQKHLLKALKKHGHENILQDAAQLRHIRFPPIQKETDHACGITKYYLNDGTMTGKLIMSMLVEVPIVSTPVTKDAFSMQTNITFNIH